MSVDFSKIIDAIRKAIETEHSRVQITQIVFTHGGAGAEVKGFLFMRASVFARNWIVDLNDMSVLEV